MIERSYITPVGKFLKTHALKGELNATLDIDAEAVTEDVPLIVDMDGIFVPFYAEGVRGKGQFASLVKLSGVDSEEEAKPFVNKTIYLLKSDLQQMDGDDEEGEYVDDFIGWTLRDSTSGFTGVISDVDTSTQNTLFLADTPDGTVYIPVTEDFIESVDTEGKTITMALPEGLADINKK